MSELTSDMLDRDVFCEHMNSTSNHSRRLIFVHDSAIRRKLAAVTQERDELLENLSLCKGNELANQLAALQARTTTIIEALESLCHAVERGDTDQDYLRQLAQDGRWAITPPPATKEQP